MYGLILRLEIMAEYQEGSRVIRQHWTFQVQKNTDTEKNMAASSLHVSFPVRMDMSLDGETSRVRNPRRLSYAILS